MCSGNALLTFWDNLLAPSLRVNTSDTVDHYVHPNPIEINAR